jgi:hypothetical protein
MDKKEKLNPRMKTIIKTIIKTIYWIIIWFALGALGSSIGISILRVERCVTMSDLVPAYGLILLGPANLIITPFATTMEMLNLRYKDKNKECVYPKFETGE